MSPQKGVFIVGAKRTAFGTFGGSFKNVNATQLQTAACKATLEAAGVKPEQVDSVTIGNVLVVSIVFHSFIEGKSGIVHRMLESSSFSFQTSQSDGIYLPRHVLLHTGIPIDKPALGVNRLCGSGFQAVVNAAQDIILGASRVSLAGGVDNMSQSPFVVRNVRFGTTFGANYSFEDSLWVNIHQPREEIIQC